MLHRQQDTVGVSLTELKYLLAASMFWNDRI